MSRSILVLLLSCAAAFGLASPARALTMSYLDNGVVKVGVDLDRGGMIVYLAPSGADPSANLVDATTLGDGIQPWFQAGADPYKIPAPPFENNPWNPSLGGDVYGHTSYVWRYNTSNDGTTIHTDTHPQQWALNDDSCTCEIEQWITLDGPAVHVRVVLKIYRYYSSADSFSVALRDQELPALHLAAKLTRLIAYTGGAPYTGGPMTELVAGAARTDVTASENWAALVDANGSGVGVIHPDITRYEYATGFLAPVAIANLYTPSDSATQYQDQSTIVLGTTAQIRAYAAAHRPDDRPDYQFTGTDDHHWTRWNVVPIAQSSTWFSSILAVDNPQLLGPDEWFQAADVPTLYIRGAWHTHDTLAQLYWRTTDYDQSSFTELRSVRFRVIDDGQMHTYAVPLSGNPLYTGTVAQLRFDPACCGEATEVDLASISWRPDPAAIQVAIEHPRQLFIRLVRDSRHRLGVIGQLSSPDDSYLPCISHVRIRLQRLLQGTWVPVKTLITGTGGAFSFALPPKSHSHYRATADLLTLKGNVCSATSVTA